MRFSMIRASVVGVSAAIALAACGGRGVVPNSNSFAQSPMAKTAMRAVSPALLGPCGIKQRGWIFGGACGSAKVKATGFKLGLRAYKGITVEVTLGTNNSTSPFMMFRDATTPGKDITGKVKRRSFPAYKGVGKAFIYFAGTNPGPAFAFNVTPGIKVVNKGKYPGKTCGLAELEPTGWTLAPLPSQLTGHTLVFPLLPAQQAIPGKSVFYLAIACH